MNTKTRSRAGGRRGRRGAPPGLWSDTEEEGASPESAPAGRHGGDDEALRQLVARRRLEQYLESKQLREHLQEIFYDDDR